MDDPSFDIDNELELQDSLEMEMRMLQEEQDFDENDYPVDDETKKEEEVVKSVEPPAKTVTPDVDEKSSAPLKPLTSRYLFRRLL
jgi:translation elongation factor EF-Tu-like GTPase